MTTLTVTVSDDRMATLETLAEKSKIAPDELLRLGIEEYISQPDDEFQAALEYALDKNSDLYRRLA